mmetsp:Transcript_29615/g.57735  ORF Transcript_29615/g.57735 Transcript_29615/m.57735 type:complete len:132 (+) Transcript_29615:2288-2683(+)
MIIRLGGKLRCHPSDDEDVRATEIDSVAEKEEKHQGGGVLREQDESLSRGATVKNAKARGRSPAHRSAAGTKSQGALRSHGISPGAVVLNLKSKHSQDGKCDSKSWQSLAQRKCTKTLTYTDLQQSDMEGL